MNKAKAKERILKLRDLINDYRYHYHVLDESLISEEAADSLKHELAELEKQYPDLITKDSPTQRVAGAVLEKFQSVTHSKPMLSINDVFSIEEVKAWQDRIIKLLNTKEKVEYFIDIKMDGLAMALVYEDGQLIRGVTRGDGQTGEDVTTNIRTIESIPLTLRKDKDYSYLLGGRTEVRGEVVMYKKDFEALNKQRQKDGLPLYANPRNTAAGTIRQLDPQMVAARKLHFRAYDLIREDRPLPTNSEVYKALKAIGFLRNSDTQTTSSLDEIAKFISTWEKKRTELPFNTDGLVIKVNDRSLFDKLGVAGKAPRGSIAFKYAAEQSTTKVKDIFISIGRTGSATPVAILEPVVIAGSLVQMATLHNDEIIKEKDIRIGDSVIVHKAGDIIPEIIEPLVKLRDGSEKIFKMPKNCPECNTPLGKSKEEDIAWRCLNPNCPSRVWKRIEHFASKTALDIEGLGEKNVLSLIEANLIADSADIYKLKASDIEKLDRFAAVSANNLATAIQAKKNPPLHRFIFGLGIRHVGEQTAVDLANNFKSLDSLQKATMEDLVNIDNIGETVAESIVEWFSRPENQDLLRKFKSLGVWPKEVVSTSGKLSGQSFVITGGLESMGREEAAEKIRSQGGTFQSSVASTTTYLVVGSNVGENKLKKARELGIKQISENDLIKLIN